MNEQRLTRASSAVARSALVFAVAFGLSGDSVANSATVQPEAANNVKSHNNSQEYVAYDDSDSAAVQLAEYIASEPPLLNPLEYGENFVGAITISRVGNRESSELISPDSSYTVKEWVTYTSGMFDDYFASQGIQAPEFQPESTYQLNATGDMGNSDDKLDYGAALDSRFGQPENIVAAFHAVTYVGGRVMNNGEVIDYDYGGAAGVLVPGDIITITVPNTDSNYPYLNVAYTYVVNQIKLFDNSDASVQAVYGAKPSSDAPDGLAQVLQLMHCWSRPSLGGTDEKVVVTANLASATYELTAGSPAQPVDQ